MGRGYVRKSKREREQKRDAAFGFVSNTNINGQLGTVYV